MMCYYSCRVCNSFPSSSSSSTFEKFNLGRVLLYCTFVFSPITYIYTQQYYTIYIERQLCVMYTVYRPYI